MVIKKLLLFLVVLFAFMRLPAQLCEGSLGDPIINITFGSGTNPGPVLTTTKNLNYISRDCPNDGSYTVRNNTSRCFVNTWHSLNADHTGDPNGYFMLINASLQRSEFYIDTIRGLCPGTIYEFAAWIMNVIVPTACFGNTIQPNLTFNIETTGGTVLQSYTSGNIAASHNPDWKQYGFFFTTPSNVSNIVLRLINNSTGGCGNDIAIDDITFRPCGPKLSSAIKGVSGLVKELCKGDSSEVTLECKVSDVSNPSFSWQESKDGGNTWKDIAGETSASLVRNFSSATPVGQYLYRCTVGLASNAALSSCKTASSVLTVRVNSNPVTSISTNSPVCEGTPLTLSSRGGAEIIEFIWSGVNSFSGKGSSVVINNARLVNGGKYYLQASNRIGCRYTDSTTAVVLAAPVITTGFTNKNICQGDSILLSSSGGIFYQWSPSAGLSSADIANPMAKPAASSVYKVKVLNALNCTDSALVTIHVIEKPKANAGPDKVIVEGQSVELEGSVTGGNNDVRWVPDLFISGVHSLTPSVTPVTNTSYILNVTSRDGCGTSSDTTNIRVFKKVNIPNAFSPNGDGINDFWKITGLSAYDDFELSVFNRYGQTVFNTKNYSRPWNGTVADTPLPVGTYYYLLDVRLGLPKVSGFVVIIR